MVSRLTLAYSAASATVKQSFMAASAPAHDRGPQMFRTVDVTLRRDLGRLRGSAIADVGASVAALRRVARRWLTGWLLNVDAVDSGPGAVSRRRAPCGAATEDGAEMAPSSYLSSIGTSQSVSILRPQNLCNGSDSDDRPAVFESGAGLAGVQDPSLRSRPWRAPAAVLTPSPRGAVLAFTAGRMNPGHHVNARTTRSGGTVNAL
jgi:hypothetical protein